MKVKQMTKQIPKQLMNFSKATLNLLISTLISLAYAITIGFLNFELIRYLFSGELSQNMGSIETSYIQMAKFWVEGGGLWQPLWYLGYPWHVFYTPVLPTLEVLLHLFAGFSFGQSYRVLTAIGYILTPITIYFFVQQISKSKTGALVSGLFYTFVPSIIAILVEEVAKDTISGGFEPRRFTILVRWGEGPHTLALAFLPLFGLFFQKYLERGKLGYLVLAAIFLGLVALTNAVAAWGAVLLFAAFFLAEISKKNVDGIGIIKKSGLLAGVTFGFISFWYNLPFLRTFFREGGGAISNWGALIPWRLILLLIFAGLIFIIIRKFTQKFQGLALSIYWFLMLFLIVFVYYASGEEHLEFAPQALRLNTEVDLALSVLVGVIVSNVFHFLCAKTKKFKVPQAAIAVLILIVPILLIYPKASQLLADLPPLAAGMEASKVMRVENTPEYKVSKTLAEMVKGTDQRVLVPGNYSFWLDYFEPIPQIRGALYQSATHYWPEHAYYQITNGSDAEISLAWLKIANIGKLVYSPELYRDFKVPREKFDSILEPKAEINGDIYYNVPLKNDSLAKIVDYQAVLAIPKPFNAIDEEPIFKYVTELEKKSEDKLKVERISNSRLRISGEISAGEGVLVQQTYDTGWHVKNWNVKRDKFDFMVLVPKKGYLGENNKFTLELEYSWPISVYFGYLVTLVTIGMLVKKGIGGFLKPKKSEEPSAVEEKAA